MQNLKISYLTNASTPLNIKPMKVYYSLVGACIIICMFSACKKTSTSANGCGSSTSTTLTVHNYNEWNTSCPSVAVCAPTEFAGDSAHFKLGMTIYNACGTSNATSVTLGVNLLHPDSTIKYEFYVDPSGAPAYYSFANTGLSSGTTINTPMKGNSPKSGFIDVILSVIFPTKLGWTNDSTYLFRNLSSMTITVNYDKAGQ